MSNVFECIPFSIDEHSRSEYCSLIEEDGISAGFICYNKKECARIVDALANSGIATSLPRQELYSGAACLVELVFLDSDCQVVHPHYHREVESLLSQTGNIKIRMESKFNSDDWFELYELLIKQPPKEKKPQKGFWVSVTQRVDGGDFDSGHFCYGDESLTEEMVERVALNFVSLSSELYKAPEEEGDDVFIDHPDPQWARFYWVNKVTEVAAQDMPVLKKYCSAVSYETLLQDGQTPL